MTDQEREPSGSKGSVSRFAFDLLDSGDIPSCWEVTSGVLDLDLAATLPLSILHSTCDESRQMTERNAGK